MNDFEEIVLLDPVINRSYRVRLSEEDAARAREDMNFASALLRYAQALPQPKEAQKATTMKTLPGTVKIITDHRTSSNASCTATISHRMKAKPLHNATTLEPVCSATSNLNTATIKASLNTTNIVEETNPSPTSPIAAHLVDNGSEDDGSYSWSKEESLLLISLYSMNEERFKSGKCTQKQCWDYISNLFAEKGYVISGRKCSTKLQALKRTYKKIKDSNNKSGNSRKTWEYFDAMEELFKEKPWVAPSSTAGSDDTECHLPIAQPQTAKSSQSVYLKELLEYKKERAQKRDIQHKEKLDALADLRNLMREHMKNA